MIEDFQFLPISLESLSLIGALTAIFVVNRKRQNLIFPSTNLSYKMIDDSYTRTTYLKRLCRLLGNIVLSKFFRW